MEFTDGVDPETQARVRRFFEDEIPFNRYLGMKLDAISRGAARLTPAFKPELVGDPFRPALHGGVISALLDTAGGAAVWSTLAPGDRVSTIDLRVDYLRPARLEALVADATVRRVGNRVGVVSIRATQPGAPDEPVAEAMGVYSIKREADPR